MEQDECRCPPKPYWPPGSLVAGSTTETRAHERWERDHGHHAHANGGAGYMTGQQWQEQQRAVWGDDGAFERVARRYAAMEAAVTAEVERILVHFGMDPSRADMVSAPVMRTVCEAILRGRISTEEPEDETAVEHRERIGAISNMND